MRSERCLPDEGIHDHIINADILSDPTSADNVVMVGANFKSSFFLEIDCFYSH